MNLKELYSSGVDILERVGISTPNVDVENLLSYLFNISISKIYLNFNNIVSDEDICKFNKFLERRINREPVANIIGIKTFWDYDFYVDSNVLTPRNDSEILIEAVIKNFTNYSEKLNILDLGTGSGCLILTLLKIYKGSKGTAVDISDKALEIAKKNAKNLEINNISFIKSNWNGNIDEKFDIIISNPPYIKKNYIKDLEPEVNKYNPLLALDGGDDGLECYRYLAQNLKKNIKEKTKIFLEIGQNQENDIINIFNSNNFRILKIYKDLSKINRILLFEIKTLD